MKGNDAGLRQSVDSLEVGFVRPPLGWLYIWMFTVLSFDYTVIQPRDLFGDRAEDSALAGIARSRTVNKISTLSCMAFSLGEKNIATSNYMREEEKQHPCRVSESDNVSSIQKHRGKEGMLVKHRTG